MINKNFMNKKTLPIIISSIFLLLISTISVHAISYVPLEPQAFTGMTSNAVQTTDLRVYLGLVFNFGIAIAIVLALVMIIWGGIIKMTTDSWTKKDDANSKIENALYGLGLALISWLILYTINPCLVQFVAVSGGCTTNNTFLTLPTQTKQSSSSALLLSLDENGLANDADIRALFKNDHINVNKENCSSPTATNCTSLDGLPQAAISGIESLRSACGTVDCITITGGTETGNPEDPTHVSHGPGIATVDVSYNPTILQAIKNSDLGLSEKRDFGGVGTRGVYTCEPAGGGKKSVPCGSGASVIHIQF